MNRFLHLTAGQLFGLFLGVPIILDILDFILSPSSDISFYIISPIITLISISVYLCWYWTVGRNFYKKLPEKMGLRINIFKAALILIVICLVLSTIATMSLLPKASNYDEFITYSSSTIPFQIIGMLCFLYCSYFVAKALKTIETNRLVSFSEYSNYFFLLIFFIIGIWYIQPKINKLFKEDK